MSDNRQSAEALWKRPAFVLAVLAGLYFAAACRVTSIWLGPWGPYPFENFLGLLRGVHSIAAGLGESPFNHRIAVAFGLTFLNRITGIALPLLLVWSQVLFLVCGFFSVRWLLSGAVPRRLADLSPLIGLPLLVWLLAVPRTDNEYAVFACAAALLAAIRHEKWVLYGLLFVPCLLVKETAVLMTLVAAATLWGRVGRLRLAAISAIQIIAFIGVKAALSFWHHAPQQMFTTYGEKGRDYFFQIVAEENLKFITGNWLPAGRWADWDWIACCLLVAFVLWRWRAIDIFFRRCSWWAAAHIGGMCLVGRLIETRIFLELVPWLTALFCLSLAQLLTIGRQSRPLRRPERPELDAGTT